MTWTVETIRDTTVDPADVFRQYVDPATWVKWGHGARSAHADGPMAEGGTVAVRGKNGMPYVCMIRRLEAGARLDLEVRTLGMVTKQPTKWSRTREVRACGPARLEPRPGLLDLRNAGVPGRYQRAFDREVHDVIATAGAAGPSTA